MNRVTSAASSSSAARSAFDSLPNGSSATAPPLTVHVATARPRTSANGRNMAFATIRS